MSRSALILLAALLPVAPALAADQQPAFKRTPLQAVDFPEGFRTVAALAEIAPGGNTGAHTHPGVETGYILEGEVVMSVEGEPDRTLKPGDSYVIAAGAVHDVKSVGDMPAKAVSVFVVDSAKSLASPVR